MYDAMTIEKTFECFMPSRDSYTSMLYSDVSKKCADLQNELVVQMTMGEPDSSIKKKHPEQTGWAEKEIEPGD